MRLLCVLRGVLLPSDASVGAPAVVLVVALLRRRGESGCMACRSRFSSSSCRAFGSRFQGSGVVLKTNDECRLSPASLRKSGNDCIAVLTSRIPGESDLEVILGLLALRLLTCQLKRQPSSLLSCHCISALI